MVHFEATLDRVWNEVTETAAGAVSALQILFDVFRGNEWSCRINATNFANIIPLEIFHSRACRKTAVVPVVSSESSSGRTNGVLAPYFLDISAISSSSVLTMTDEKARSLERLQWSRL